MQDNVTYYPLSPLDYAKRWVEEGADWLHVIDLNAALGTGNNLELIKNIVREVKNPVQVGGGVRSLEYASALLDAGATRVIISSIFFTNREEARKILTTYGAEHVIIALDSDSSGTVVIKGWKEKTQLKLHELLPEVLKFGFNEVLVTDISRDGTLMGVDGGFLNLIPEKMRGHVIVAGGISRIGDILMLSKLGFAGAVLGKALYENVLSVSTALKALSVER